MKQHSRWPVLLLLATLAATMYAGDIDIGPFSARVYLYLALGGWMFARCVIAGEPILADRRAQWLLLSYVVFVAWATIALVLQRAPLSLIGGKTVTYHALSVFTAILTLFIVRTRADVAIFVRGFVVIVLVSCAVAVLQWLRVPQAWNVWHALRPQIEAVPGEPGLQDDGASRLAGPGLFATTAVFGYYISALAPVLFRRFMVRRSLATAVALLLGIAGLFVIQQRASMLAVVITCGFLLLAQMRERGRRVRGFALALLVLAFLAVPAFIAYRTYMAEGRIASRYFSVRDVGRLQVVEIAIKFIAANPIVGGATEYMAFYEEEQWAGTRYQAITPHNMFLNAAVYYGIPGLLLIVAFTAQLAVLMARVWREARARRDWTSLTLVMALLGYLISAQFHNASFVTGDVLPWVLISLLLTASPERATEPAAVPQRLGAHAPA